MCAENLCARFPKIKEKNMENNQQENLSQLTVSLSRQIIDLKMAEIIVLKAKVELQITKDAIKKIKSQKDKK